MQTFFATLLIFALVVLAMGIGVLVTGRRLQGSCGGTGEACKCSRAEQRDCSLKKAAAEGGG